MDGADHDPVHLRKLPERSTNIQKVGLVHELACGVVSPDGRTCDPVQEVPLKLQNAPPLSFTMQNVAEVHEMERSVA